MAATPPAWFKPRNIHHTPNHRPNHPTTTAAAGIRHTIAQVQSAAGPKYESTREGHPDFALTHTQLEVDDSVDEIGWLGYYVESVAKLGSRVNFVPQYFDGAEWVDRHGTLEHSHLNEFLQPAGPLRRVMGRSTWIQGHLELLMRLGEFAVWPEANPSGDFSGWFTAHPGTLQKATSREPMFVAKLRPDARQGSTGWIETPLELLERCLYPDTTYPWLARTPIARILPEARAFKALCERVQVDANSRLLMNGLLYIHTNETDVADPDATEKTGIDLIVDTFGAMSRRAWTEPGANQMSRAAPFPFPHHTAPEVIDLGRDIDENLLPSMLGIVESAARGLNVPMDYILDGAGSGNHWDSAEKRRQVNEQAVFPTLGTYVDWWTPRFQRYLEATGSTGEPQRWRIWYDPSPIVIREDNVAQVQATHDRVGLKREVLARMVGLTADDLIEPPDGMDDDQLVLQLLRNARTSQEPATGDEEVAEPDEGTPIVDQPQAIAAAARLLEM